MLRNFMPTKNPRFNVTFDPDEGSILATLAKKERKSISRLAKELILEALERREDKVLSEIADTRAKESKATVSHKNAWK